MNEKNFLSVAKRFFVWEIFFLILFAISFSRCIHDGIKIENIFLTTKEKTQPIKFPATFERSSFSSGEFSFEIFSDKAYSLEIVPDDCVESLSINEKKIPVKNIRGRCDFSHGFTLSQATLKKFLGDDLHARFKLTVKNNGGQGGLNVTAKNAFSWKFFVSQSLAFISFFLLSGSLLLRFKIPPAFALVLVLGACLRFFFFLETPYSDYSHDVEGHIAYIEWISENKQIPSSDKCWSCYHPPLYYVALAPVFTGASALGFTPHKALQFVSLIFSLLTFLFAFRVFASFLSGGKLLVSTLLLSFWPLLSICAPRIGNDIPFYLFHIVALWAGFQYMKTQRGKFMCLAALVTTLALFTKSTGVVTLCTSLLCFLVGYCNKEFSLKPARTEIISSLLFVILTGWFSFSFFSGNSLVGNASGLNPALLVENSIGNYLYFDLRAFLTEPFAHPWSDLGGRQYFWNYALKTSLFGEFTFPGKVAASSAGILSFSFIGFMLFMLRGFWKAKLSRYHIVLIFQAILFFSSLLFLRIHYPYSCSNDFRYILPVLLSLIPFISEGILSKGKLRLKLIGIFLILLFSTASVSLLLNA